MSGFSINTVTVSGNLTRDPELRSTPSGTAVCSLRIANAKRVKNGQTGDWEDKPRFFDVTVWSGMGEWLARNLSKGDPVVVNGELEWREWQDQSGNKRQTVDITAWNVVPGQRGGGGGGRGGVTEEDRAAAAGFSARSDVPVDASDFATASAPASGATATPDDDIPF